METIDGIANVIRYTNFDYNNLFSKSEKRAVDKLTESQEVKNYIKKVNDIKARLNDKQNGAAADRAYNAFMSLLAMMGDMTKYLNIEQLTDAELYKDMSRGKGAKATGHCYGFEALEWLGKLLTHYSDDMKSARTIITAITKLGLILPNDDESAVAVTVNGVHDIHRVTVSDMNGVIKYLVSDLKHCLRSPRFYKFVNNGFKF